MESGSTRIVLVAGISSLFSCLLTLLVVGLLRDPESPPPLERETTSPELTRVAEELARLVERIDDRLTVLEPGVESRPMRTEVLPRSNDSTDTGEERRVDTLMERLERTLERRPEALETNSPVRRDIRPDWAALDQLCTLGRSTEDEDAVKRAVMLLTPAEVVARYGFPDQVHSSQHHDMYWAYVRNRPDGEQEDVSFYFKGGFVVHCEYPRP